MSECWKEALKMREVTKLKVIRPKKVPNFTDVGMVTMVRGTSLQRIC